MGTYPFFKENGDVPLFLKTVLRPGFYEPGVAGD